ncbi:hypothetical protein NE237_013170 [Protea cynaroides]|uniref:RNase H type-1 domain-containing protein n=1 Tax=Protea cynaroides TaxID=273540 RepID=A0A9Q0JYP8_9MAGN|nr:hypothetical protein NE237_013170 [Protea cynaroides]
MQEDDKVTATVTLVDDWYNVPDGFYILNTDAVLLGYTQSSGIGYIIRGSQGASVMAVSIPLVFNSVEVGEGLAIRAGLLAALNAGLSKLLVKSESLSVINLINRKTSGSDSFVTYIVEDIWKLSSKGRLLSLIFS